MRARLLLLLVLTVLVYMGSGVLRGQQPAAATPPPSAEQQKRLQFLKAREEMHALPPTTPATASPAPKPKPHPKATPKEPPKPIPKETPKETPKPPPEVTPKPHTPAPATPKPVPVTPHPEKERPATPLPLPKVTPAPATPLPRVTPAPVTVEKSGYEESHGLQPSGGFSWFTRWKYLSKGVQAEINRAPVARRRWRYIVVHNSGTRQGNAKAFEYYHRYVRHMQNGLAYQFVIGNGTSSGDGEVEVGNRWKRQINGGHVHSDYLNNIALGICLVGDFNREKPTQRQLATLDELIRFLRQRVGSSDVGKYAVVKAHREINPPRWPTDCPGNEFPYAWLHKQFDE